MTANTISTTDITATGTATFATTTVGDLSLTGTVRDSDGDLGTIGQVLVTTATGTNWVDQSATTTLSTTGITTSTSTNSGLEFSGTELSLLRGCAQNEILKWDATTERWQCSPDGGIESVYDIYDNAGGQVPGAAVVTVNMDTTRVDNPNYTLAGDVVTVNSDGLYEVTFTGSANTTNNTRSAAEWLLQTDTGAGFADVDGSRCYTYHRTSADGENSCSRTVILDLVDTDEIRLRMDVLDNSGGVVTVADGSGMTIRKIVESGADYAEIYYTNNSDLEGGDVVAIDAGLQFGVDKAASSSVVFGIISSNPGATIGLSEGAVTNPGRAVPVALKGRVPVKVDLTLGDIAIGDQIALSSISGVAKKADAGDTEIIGVALEAYTDADWQLDLLESPTNDYAQITAFISLGSGTNTPNQTVPGDLAVDGSILDSLGNAGTVGQILASTASGTQWIDLVDIQIGTATGSTLFWDGTDWIENTTFTVDGSGNATSTASFFSNLVTALTGNFADLFADTAVIETLTATTTNTTDLTATDATVGNIIITGTVADSDGDIGTAGQILSSTATGTNWVDDAEEGVFNQTFTFATSTNTLSITDSSSTLDVDLSYLFDQISFTEATGTPATPGNVIGDWYKNIDGGDTYVWDGTEWELLSGAQAADSRCILGTGIIDGTAGTITSSNGVVSGVTRTAEGRYTVSFSQALNPLEYLVLANSYEPIATRDDIAAYIDTQNATNTTIFVTEQDNGGAAGVYRDRDFNIAILDSTCSAGEAATTTPQIADGTSTDSTLRWNGSAWVENTTLVADGTGNATSTGSFFSNVIDAVSGVFDNTTVTGTASLATTTITGTLEVGFTDGSILFDGANGVTEDNTNLSFNDATDTLTAGNLIVTGTIADSDSEVGTVGQLLSSTATGTDWIDPRQIFTGTFTQGALLFADTDGKITEDPTNFFIDDVNNRLGIGTSTPTQALEVIGNVQTSGTFFGNTAEFVSNTAAQLLLAFDGSNDAGFIVNAIGDLLISPSGEQVIIGDNDLLACEGGACPTLLTDTASSTAGNVIAENNVAVGGTIVDSTGAAGESGQVLTSDGSGSIAWTAQSAGTTIYPFVDPGSETFDASSVNNITITGSGFIPTSVVTIPGAGATVVTTVVSPTQIDLQVTTSTTTGFFDIVVTNDTVDNTTWTNNGVNYITVGTVVTERFEVGLGDWVQSAADDRDWTRQTGGTGSGGTGPNGAAGGAFYLYTETSNPVINGDTFILENTTSAANIDIFTFDYHMFGAAMGNLEIQRNDGTSWIAVQTLSGQQQAGQSDPYLTSSIDVSALNTSGGMRFLYTRGTDFTGDAAIDNVSLTNI